MAQQNINDLTKLFGFGKEGRRPGDPLIVTEDTTSWEIYNHKAAEVDREMIKDWNNSLNTLLIFTALYSAVLTAFIIESMKLLHEDPTETTRNILIIISKQLSNNSLPAFEPIAYQTPQYAVVVNALFFTSLSCALIAALSAVLALQWVANYDMGLNTSSARKRALQRHVRFRGVEKWRMAEFIASLPLLIFMALFLFFIGIADWLWHMNRAISGIVIGGIGIGCLLYTVTNLISITNVVAPFRTPISKELPVMMRQVLAWFQKIIIILLSTWHGLNGPEQDADHTTEPQLTFNKREENTFEGKDAIAIDGILWLANNIEISPPATSSFIALLKDLSEVPALTLMDEEKLKDAPWDTIFEMLCSPYIGKKEYGVDELERAKWICKGMAIMTPYLESPLFRRFLGGLLELNDRSLTSMAYFAYSKLPGNRRSIGIDTAFEHTSGVVSQIGYNYLYFMLLDAKEVSSSSSMPHRTRLVKSMANAWAVPSTAIRNGSPSDVIPVDLIDLILNFVIPRVEVDTFEARYLAATQPFGRRWSDAIHSLLRMMAQQLIAQISYKFDSSSGYTKELELLSFIMESRREDLIEEKDDFVWVLVDKSPEAHGYDRFLSIGDDLCRGMYCKAFTSAWVDLVLALDDFVTRLPPSSFHFYSKTVHFIKYFIKYPTPFDRSNSRTLAQVRDSCLAWIISWRCPSDVQFQGLIHPEFGNWNDTIEREVNNLFKMDLLELDDDVKSDARISFH
ncbi:9392_t:CDS:2 [Acaulospora colombiana]|uniref:9392_t:CDS:1 n=1 Tax=Acaulospora colombiana TaxID=27376 RepID=A0ACA9K543_9GLOM|nr:9392_t:CDS:2 [Acaulospora colombiana]